MEYIDNNIILCGLTLRNLVFSLSPEDASLFSILDQLNSDTVKDSDFKEEIMRRFREVLEDFEIDSRYTYLMLSVHKKSKEEIYTFFLFSPIPLPDSILPAFVESFFENHMDKNTGLWSRYEGIRNTLPSTLYKLPNLSSLFGRGGSLPKGTLYKGRKGDYYLETAIPMEEFFSFEKRIPVERLEKLADLKDLEREEY